MAEIVKRVFESKWFSILFDETTDISHTSQMSLVVRYVHEGFVREDFVECIDPHATAYKLDAYDSEKDNGDNSNRDVHVDTRDIENEVETDNGNTIVEPKLTGKVLGKLVIKRITKIGLVIDNCVGISTDGCSVMASKVCGNSGC